MIVPVLAEVPALPLHEAGKYVAGAYVVLVVVLLIYVTIMGIRLSRMERELGELLELTESAGAQAPAPQETPHADAERSPA